MVGEWSGEEACFRQLSWQDVPHPWMELVPQSMWGVMLKEPWKTQDEQQLRMIQDVELDGIVVIARHEYRNLGGLVCECAQSVAFKGPSRNRVRQRNLPEPQMLGQSLTDDTSIGTRVYQSRVWGPSGRRSQGYKFVFLGVRVYISVTILQSLVGGKFFISEHTCIFLAEETPLS